VPTTPKSASAISRSLSKLNANAQSFIPSRTYFSNENSRTSSDSEAPNLANNHSPNPYDSSDEDDPTLQYVRLRLKFEQMSNKNNWARAQFEEHRRRLSELQKDLLFNEREAESLFQKERDKLLLERLRGSTSPPPSPAIVPKPKVQKDISAKIRVPQEEVQESSSADVFNDADSDESGGLFDLLEELPATETTNTGTIITLKDMALPKQWAGRTPKILLKETVARLDRYAVITYNLISGSSRAKRASVTVCWDGAKEDKWTMNDVACPDETQAEHYIALTALHALTFPQSEGFACSSGGPSNSTFFRLLPPTFRDLWGELEEVRKEKEDSRNRQVWAKLHSIIEPKVGSDKKVRTCLLNGAESLR
jgi:ATP-dependent RNA helicase DHX29